LALNSLTSGHPINTFDLLQTGHLTAMNYY